ncbi:MAG: IS110 family transposase [Thermoplasmata archaeon]|nr:IS110 family transposase [Thermoplasmata archaeon]
MHQATVVACVLVSEDGKAKPRKVVRTFRTVRCELEELRAWVLEQAVTTVVMEGTGVYWRPVYAVLEGHLDLYVVNARHVRNVPGRKTDVKDSEWLATLLRMGLLRKSFVPSKAIRALRDLTRYRRMLVQSETTEKNRILKVLETAGVKVATFASDVFGVSGMAMLKALASGELPPEQIADLARGKLRQKVRDLHLAFDVLIEDHHRILLRDLLERLAQTAKDIARYEDLLETYVTPYEKNLGMLCTIDGIQRCAAIEIFAEVGPDLADFPSDANFAAWTGTCPGKHESAGKETRARRRRGNPYLQSILVQAALAASRKKATYLRDKYHRLKARRGSMRALFAIAHKLARAVYRVLTTGEPYRDLGAEHLDAKNKNDVVRHLVNRLRRIASLDEVVASFNAQRPPETTSAISGA